PNTTPAHIVSWIVYLRPDNNPIAQGRRTCGDHDDIETSQGTFHDGGTRYLTDRNLAGDKSQNGRRPAGKVNQLDIQTIFFKNPRVFRNPSRQLFPANSAIAYIQFY